MAMEQPHSRGWYRRNAIHNMTGNTKMQPVLDEKTHEVYTDFNAVQFSYEVLFYPTQVAFVGCSRLQINVCVF